MINPIPPHFISFLAQPTEALPMAVQTASGGTASLSVKQPTINKCIYEDSENHKLHPLRLLPPVPPVTALRFERFLWSFLSLLFFEAPQHSEAKTFVT